MSYMINSPYTYGNVTITTPSMGKNGYVYTSTGTNGTSWVSPASTTGIDAAASLQQSGTLELRGKNADVKINGVSLNETLEGIQEMLGIVVPVHELEDEFEELQQAGKEYRRLLKKFKEQKAVWETLKKQDL